MLIGFLSVPAPSLPLAAAAPALRLASLVMVHQPGVGMPANEVSFSNGVVTPTDLGSAYPSATVHGADLRTWSYDAPDIEVVQVVLSSEGRPLEAEIELWQGPDSSPIALRCFSENGLTCPVNAVIETPRIRFPDATVAIRNNGMPESPPLDAHLIPNDVDRPTADCVDAFETLQGGDDLRTLQCEPSVASVQVLLTTDGRPLDARIELLDGANDLVKQVIELHTEDGCHWPFFCILELPEPGTVVRVVNTAPVEFPMSAAIVPRGSRGGFAGPDAYSSRRGVASWAERPVHSSDPYDRSAYRGDRRGLGSVARETSGYTADRSSYRTGGRGRAWYEPSSRGHEIGNYNVPFTSRVGRGRGSMRYNDNRYRPSPYAPSPYAPSPYAPSPYAPKPYAPPPYAPSPYVPPPRSGTTYNHDRYTSRGSNYDVPYPARVGARAANSYTNYSPRGRVSNEPAASARERAEAAKATEAAAKYVARKALDDADDAARAARDEENAARSFEYQTGHQGMLGDSWLLDQAAAIARERADFSAQAAARDANQAVDAERAAADRARRRQPGGGGYPYTRGGVEYSYERGVAPRRRDRRPLGPVARQTITSPNMNVRPRGW